MLNFKKFYPWYKTVVFIDKPEEYASSEYPRPYNIAESVKY